MSIKMFLCYFVWCGDNDRCRYRYGNTTISKVITFENVFKKCHWDFHNHQHNQTPKAVLIRWMVPNVQKKKW
jgi:hypothetical protein